MAFFQVLPKETGIAERFGEGFGQAFGGTLQDQIGQFFHQKQDTRALETLENKLQGITDPAQKISAIASLRASPELKKSLIETEREKMKLQLQSQLKRQEQAEKLQGLMQILNIGTGKDPSLDSIQIDEGEDITGRPSALNISDEQILLTDAAGFPTAARILQAQKDAALKHQDRIDDRAEKRNEAYNKRLDELRFNKPKLDLALLQMGAALETGNFESFRNIIAELTGFEFLKNAPAQVVNAAAKEFLQAALGELTGRPNQWIEQQISKALINPLYRKEANQLIYKGLQHLQQLRDKEIIARDEIEEEYRKKGRVPFNLQSLVQKRLQKDIDAFEKDYRKDLEALNKRVTAAEASLKKVPQGTPLTEEAYRKIRAKAKSKEEALKLAKKMGYSIPEK